MQFAFTCAAGKLLRPGPALYHHARGTTKMALFYLHYIYPDILTTIQQKIASRYTTARSRYQWGMCAWAVVPSPRMYVFYLNFYSTHI